MSDERDNWRRMVGPANAQPRTEAMVECWAKDPLIHITPKCEHVFAGWREFEGGGEQVCTKCGIGAMTASMREGL